MGQQTNILIIEENPPERVRLREVLENYGCHVDSCGTTSEGTDLMADVGYRLIIVSHEAPGIPCTDFVLNVMTGEDSPDVLVTSATASVDNAVSVMRAGAVDFAVKPMPPETLLSYVDNVMSTDSETAPALSKEAPKRSVGPEIVTENEEIQKALALIEQVADSSASVLIQGESGTGKELFARYLHSKSSRCNNPFVAVNCAALPETLLESELFGHEKGAFTGAISRKAGKFELAGNGTILLDEITEMQPHLQAKLLRVLQEREVDLIGGTQPVRIDARVIATTNRNIEESVEKGDFREDLYYRLNVIPLTIPPLRKRRNDILPLAGFFIRKFNRLDGRNVKSLTTDAIAALESHRFKGNVRELENMIHRAVLLSDGKSVKVADLMLRPLAESSAEEISGTPELTDDILASPLKEVERKMIMHTLEKTGGNRTHAAKILEISVRTLRNKLNEYKTGNIPA